MKSGSGEARTPQEGMNWNKFGHLGIQPVAQEGSALVETQAWREQVERVQRGLTGGMKDQWEAQKSLDALTAQMEEMEGELDESETQRREATASAEREIKRAGAQIEELLAEIERLKR